MINVKVVFAQNLTFTNENLKKYLLTENSVDIDNNGFGDTIIDLNQDNEIQLQEALLVQNLVISPKFNDTISSIKDISQFTNLKRLTIPRDIGVIEISELGLDSLNYISVSNQYSLFNINLSDLKNLTSIALEGLIGVQYLNLQNGSYASDYFSLFFTYVDYACVDSIAEEYNIVQQHIKNGGLITTICDMNVENDNFEFKTYPNPSKNKIYINQIFQSAILYDINGKFIDSWDSYSNELDISFLESGLYIIMFKLPNNYIIEKKLIKL